MSQLFTERDVREIVAASSGENRPQVISYSLGNREKFGYLGTHLTLKVRICENGEEKEKSFFVKTHPVSPNPENDIIGETGMFVKEVTFYQDVFTKFRVCSRGPEWAPKYYFSKPRVLVLEDLSQEKFGMKTGTSMLDKEHLKLALKSVAALHACTFVFEQKEGNKIDAIYPDSFKEILYDENNKNSLTYMWKKRQTEDVTAAVDFLNKYSPPQKEMIKKYIPLVIDKIYPLSKKSERWVNVMVHGDMWSNNLLFRYRDGKPVDCRLVDYQFSRYAPPMHDVMHLFHLTTDISFRTNNEDELIKIYYQHLTEYLALNDVDINKFYPWNKFIESKTEYKLLALIQSLLSIHYLLGGRKLQEDPKLKDLNRHEMDNYLREIRGEYMKDNFADKNYATRVGGILCELIDEFILNESQREQMGIKLERMENNI